MRIYELPVISTAGLSVAYFTTPQPRAKIRYLKCLKRKKSEKFYVNGLGWVYPEKEEVKK